MSTEKPPRTARAPRSSGAHDAHGDILAKDGGKLFVHMHRQHGLSHRHYVLKPWQVNLLAALTSRVGILLLVVGFASWGWFAAQAGRTKLLELRLAQMESDSLRLDTLRATLTELQARYDQVQKMLSLATANSPQQSDSAATQAKRDSARTPAGVGGR